MPKHLPLYESTPHALVTQVDPVPFNPACTACALHTLQPKVVCMQADAATRGDGSANVLLVLGDAPTKIDDATRRPFTSPAGKYVRGLLGKMWSGPVVYDTAVRCAPGDKEVDEKHIDACRGYTASVLAAAPPARIVVLGQGAAYSVLGRKPPPTSVRRGYGWLHATPGAAVPVFFGMPPHYATRNRFVAKQFESDLRWALTANVQPPPWALATRTHVSTVAEAMQAYTAMRASDLVVLDTETSGVMFDNDFRVETITLWGVVDGEAALHGYTWDRSVAGAFDDAVLAPLRYVLHACDTGGHNIKFDAHAVRLDPDIHTRLGNMKVDTRLWRKLLAGTIVSGKLDVASELVGVGGHKAEAKKALDPVLKDLGKLAGEQDLKPLKSGKPRKPYEPKALRADLLPPLALQKIRDERTEALGYAYRFIDPTVRTRYNARDAFTTALLVEHLEPQVRAQQNLWSLWDEVTRPVMRALERMEERGMCVDVPALNAFDGFLGIKLTALDARMRVYGDINFNSVPQLRDLLFNKLGLRRVKLSEGGGDSTDSEVLDELKDEHPLVADLLEHRRLFKLRSQYASGMMPHVREDGRIHTSVLMDGTDTGRFSSTRPNLFNMPRPKDEKGNTEGKLARDIFVAPPGYTLLEADQSQIELRVAAMVSRDPVMIDLYKRGVDFHDATAGLIAQLAWNISPEKWAAMSKEERSPFRSSAKTVNFGILYGKTPYSLADDLKCKVEEAERIMKAVLGRFKRLHAWISGQHAAAQRDGGVSVPWRNMPANWRWLVGVGEYGNDKSVEGRRRHALNAAVNTPIQGWASYFTTASLWPIQKAFDDEGLDAHLVLTVYDSVMAEVLIEHADAAARIMQREMTAHESCGVPLVADLKRGRSWGSLLDFKLPEAA